MISFIDICDQITNLMLRIKLLFLFFFFLLSNLNTVTAQGFPLTDNASISLLTCGVGNESHSFYGHTALRVKDDSQGIDVVYNFGYFDFDTPNFIGKFSKGDLQYFVGASSFSDFKSSYIADNRSVFEQELNLNNSQKQKLFDKLNHALNSDEKYYTYKFIDRNCTTMVIDRLNAILGSIVIKLQKPETQSYRDILYTYQKNHFFENLGINILFGKKVDKPFETMFLPLVLMENVSKTTYNGKPLAKETTTIFQAKEEKPFSLINNYYTFSVVILLILVSRKKWLYTTYFTIMGILGLVTVFMAFYSLHEELSWNYNILLFNPALLVLIYFQTIKNKKWIFNIAFFNLLCIAIYLVLIINKVQLVLFLPMLITSSILLVKLTKTNRRKNRIAV